MRRSPATRASLIVRLRNPGDRHAWAEFVEVYRPLLFAYGRRRGLQDADASDLVQEVLRAVAAAAGRFAYDPARGSFRGWLLTITRNELNRLLRRARGAVSGEGGTTHLALLAQRPDEVDTDPWDEEQRRRLFARAVDRVRPTFHASTWAAFWETAVKGRPAEDVAAELRISVGAVYIAKCRALARLRGAVATASAVAIPILSGPHPRSRSRRGAG